MSLESRMSPYVRALVRKQKKEGCNCVHISVGKTRQAFAVEKDKLYRHAPYFKEVLKDLSEEFEPASIDLPKTEVKTFKLFCSWLYEQKLGSADEEIAQWKAERDKSGKGTYLDNKSDEEALTYLGDSVTESTSSDFDDKENVALVKFCQPQMASLLSLYLFADMARVPALKNECITKFYEFTKATGYIMTPWLWYMWKYTSKTSMMRKFLLDLLTWEMPPSLLETNSKDFPEDLRLELLISMGYVIQVARHGSLALEKNNPLRDLSKYYERVD
ncbi:hypothetical protein NHQ30_010922 [Ciborinia camelliae]|nr:hypothetical protein NHQ30_010922 [Ciborinia camelliae]